MNCRQGTTSRLTSTALRRARRGDSACGKLAVNLAGLLLVVLMATGAPAQLLPEASFDGAAGRLASPALSTFLRADGSVDLEAVRGSGYEGPIDLGGLGMVTDPERSHLQSVDPLPPAAPQVAGDEHWAGGFMPAGFNGPVRAMVVWRGALIAGGEFTSVGGTTVGYIARWDGVSWSPLGTGMNNVVFSLAFNGADLIAGGDFTSAGGTTAGYIARWDGVSWSPLGTGMNNFVRSLAFNGTDLIAGGSFTSAGGVTTNRIARWDGVSWSSLGTGMNDAVYSLASNGTDLIAGGVFTSAGGVATNRIARWDGVSWTPLGTGMNGVVYSLAFNGTDLIAGGEFTSAGGDNVDYIARWDGVSWSSLGTGMGSYVMSLASNGTDLIAGGYFTSADGVTTNRIARWDGVSWSSLGTGMNHAVYSLAVNGTDLIAGGYFTQSEGVTTNRIARWSAGTWLPLGAPQGAGNAVQALLVDAGGLVAGGDFEGAGSAVNARRMARFDGSDWSPLGTGMDQSVRALTRHGADIIAGGYFLQAGGLGASRVARWDGAGWSALGAGTNERVLALASLSGTLYAGGGFTTAGGTAAAGIAGWNGTSWSPLGSGVPSGTVYALTAHEGALIVGGTFTAAGGLTCQRIGRWDGAAWSTLPGMSGPVLALGHYGGQLVAGGNFVTAGGVAAGNIAIYDGTTWHPLGTGTSGQVLTMAEVGGRLYVGGDFTSAGGVTINRLAVWDGTSWSALGSGLNAPVRSLAFVDPYLYAGGDFTTAGGKPSSYIARWDGLLGTCGVTVLQPAAAAELCGGLPFDIRWTYTGDCGPLVNLDLLHDGVFCSTIATQVSNTGSYAWVPTACAGTADGYSVRVTETESSAVAVGGTFRILPAGAITVTAPNGGEHLVTGEPTALTWSQTTCCGPLVRVELLWGGGVCAVLADSRANDGAMTWTAAPLGGSATGYRLRITDLASGNVDISDADFVIGPAYRITLVRDVGGDQGGRVRVQWHREDNDQLGGAATITQYSVWRRVDAGHKGAVGDVPPELGTMAYPPGAWDFVTTVPAGGELSYGTLCASLCDSMTAGVIPWSVYFVRAHTPQPLVFFDTLPDSGYSVDNLAPAVPTGLKWQSPSVLAWDAARDSDFQYFSVYANVVSEANRIGDTIGRNLDVSGSTAGTYLVTATDCHGNEGPAAELLATSGVPSIVPTEFALYNCVPNPFNPQTTISFDVPRDGRVTVRIFDAAGRAVSTLLDAAVVPAGHTEVVWRGLDDRGRHVSAGVYFCRMDAGAFSDTKRLTLIK